MTQSFRPAEIYALARLAFPLGLATLLTSLYADIPNYFLAGAFGERVVGFFAAVATTMSLEEIVVSALGQSALHRLAYFYAHSRPSFRYLLARLVLIGIGTGLAGVLVSILWGGDLLRIFFREEYAGFTHVLVWLMIARGVLNVYSFLGYGMTAARKFKVQVWVSGLMTGSLFLACWQLVPRFSGQGAAWSISISACVGLVMAALVLSKDSFLPVKISM